MTFIYQFLCLVMHSIQLVEHFGSHAEWNSEQKPTQFCSQGAYQPLGDLTCSDRSTASEEWGRCLWMLCVFGGVFLMRETVPIILSRGHLYCVFPKFFFYFLKCLDKMVSDAGNDWGQEEKGATEDEMLGWHHWLNGHEIEQSPGDREGQGSLECWSPWGHKELGMTQ